MADKFRLFLTLMVVCVVLHIPLNLNATQSASPPASALPVPSAVSLLGAPSGVLIDAKTGIVIYDKNMLDKSYPASTTKVMTTLLLIEYIEKNKNNDFSVRIPFSHDAVFNLEPGSSNIAMNEGETLTAQECLYAMLLPSANEVCNAVAEYISGSTAEFAKLMTARANELGAAKTFFCNSNGLFNENHYTTVYDMAVIMREAIKHPEFTKIIASTEYTIPPTEKQAQPRLIHNSNKLIQQGKYFNPDVIGSKTGYTVLSKHALTTYAKRDGMELIAVVMGAEKNIPYTDTKTLLDYGFTNFKDTAVFDKLSFSETLPVTQTYKDKDVEVATVVLVAEKYVTLNLHNSFIPANVVKKLDLSAKSLTAPVKSGEKVGKLTLTYEGNFLAEIGVFTENAVPALGISELIAMFAKTEPTVNPGSKDEDSVQAFAPTNGVSFKLIDLIIPSLFVLALLALFTIIRTVIKNNKLKPRKAQRSSLTQDYRSYRYKQ